MFSEFLDGSIEFDRLKEKIWNDDALVWFEQHASVISARNCMKKTETLLRTLRKISLEDTFLVSIVVDISGKNVEI